MRRLRSIDGGWQSGGDKPKTIAVKLTADSRLYDAAVEYGLIKGNPAWGVKPLDSPVSAAHGSVFNGAAGAGLDAMADSPLLINLSNFGQGERLSRRGIRQVVDKYLLAANLKYMEGRTLSAHSLRHTSETLALRNGASLRQVQDLLGHADPRTTAIYAHVRRQMGK